MKFVITGGQQMSNQWYDFHGPDQLSCIDTVEVILGDWRDTAMHWC